MKPTKAQVQAEIATLREMKPKVREFGMTGNNRDAIEAQITVLAQQHTEKVIYDKFGNEDDDDFAENILDNALYAGEWLAGTEQEPPSLSWMMLVE